MRSLAVAVCAAAAAFALSVSFVACTTSEARPPATNDKTAPGGNSQAGTDGGTSLGDGGSGAAATFGAAARHAAIDTSAIYVTVNPTLDADAGPDAGANGSIVAIPRNGVAPFTIESGGAPDDILSTSSLLFWSDISGAPGQAVVYRASLGSQSAATPVATGLQGPVLLASDAIYVYFASNIVGASGVTIDRAALGGGAVTNVATVPGELTAGSIVSDGNHVYVAVNGLAGGEVVHVPAGGGAVDVIWSSPVVHAVDLVLSGGTLYLAVGALGANGGLVAVQTTAPATTTTLNTGDFTPTAIALDGSYAYMTVVSGGAGVLARFPLAGGDPVTLAQDIGSPVDLVVGDAVYVATDNAVLRVAK